MNKIKDFVVAPDNHLDLVQIHLVGSYNSTKMPSLVQCNAMDTTKLFVALH